MSSGILQETCAFAGFSGIPGHWVLVRSLYKQGLVCGHPVDLDVMTVTLQQWLP